MSATWRLSLLQGSANMRVFGNAFNSANEFYYPDWELSYTAGSARWFPEFTPVNFALRFMFNLLKHFLRHDVCYHIGGAFSTYLEGVQTGFLRVSFFIALKDSPLLNLLFQREETLRESFYLGCYDFELYQNLQHTGRHPYVASSGTVRNGSDRDRMIPAEFFHFEKVNFKAGNSSGR